MVRTAPFHGVNSGSIPGGATVRDLFPMNLLESLKTQVSFGVPLSISAYLGISSTQYQAGLANIETALQACLSAIISTH